MAKQPKKSNDAATKPSNSQAITGDGAQTGLPKNTWRSSQQLTVTERPQSRREIQQRRNNYMCHTLVDDYSRAEYYGTDLRVVASHPQAVVDALRRTNQAIVEHDTKAVEVRQALGFQ